MTEKHRDRKTVIENYRDRKTDTKLQALRVRKDILEVNWIYVLKHFLIALTITTIKLDCLSLRHLSILI